MKERQISTFLGVSTLVFGLVFVITYAIYFSDYRAYQTGRVIEATIIYKTDQPKRSLSLQYLDYRGLVVDWPTHVVSEEQFEQAELGGKVVGLVKDNSPSEVIIQSDLPLTRPPLGLLLVSSIITFFGLGLLLLPRIWVWQWKKNAVKDTVIAQRMKYLDESFLFVWLFFFFASFAVMCVFLLIVEIQNPETGWGMTIFIISMILVSLAFVWGAVRMLYSNLSEKGYELFSNKVDTL